MQNRQFVSSLQRGLSVLQTFSRNHGRLSNGQLSKQTKLAPSTISRLIHTLREVGYVTYDRSTRSYPLTPQVLTLGHPVLSQASLSHQIRPVLEQIAKEVGETCGFAQRSGLYATFLDCIRGRNMLSVRMEIGARCRSRRRLPACACSRRLASPSGASSSHAFAPRSFAAVFLSRHSNNGSRRLCHHRSSSFVTRGTGESAACPCPFPTTRRSVQSPSPSQPPISRKGKCEAA